jgi:hypothetical protein
VKLLPVRIPRVSEIVLSTLIAVLAGTVGYALQRELTTVPTDSAAPSREAPEQKALSPAEEAYAEALLPIQRAVSVAALRMSFAGIDFKTEDNDARRFADAIRQVRE